MKSILDKMGITPNAMQQDAMHALLRSDKDVVVLSPTGSGKTLAYLLPLTQLVDAGDDMPQAIVVTPGSRLLFSRIWEVVCVPWLAMEAE